MNQTDIIHSLVPGIPGLGSIALAVLVLWIAVGVVFFAFHWRQKQIVGCGGLLFFGLPRVIRAFVIVFGFVVALAFLPPQKARRMRLRCRWGIRLKGRRQIPLLPTLHGRAMCRGTITIWGFYETVIRRLGNFSEGSRQG